ncbi:MAG: hypothetical protein EP344_11090 [Bacteroidetes bacterium]|nr:MAG: hypothetical protein EP344_11090 [Bacteroidota bacterium]
MKTNRIITIIMGLFLVTGSGLIAQNRLYFDIGVSQFNLLKKDLAFYPETNHRSGTLIDLAFGYNGIRETQQGGYLWKINFSAGTFDRRFDSALSDSPTFSITSHAGYAWNTLPNGRLQLHTMGGFNWLRISGQKPESYLSTSGSHITYYGTDPSSAALAAYYNQLANEPHLVTIQGFPATKRMAFSLNLGARLKLLQSPTGTVDWYFDYTPVFWHGVRHDWRTGIGFRF